VTIQFLDSLIDLIKIASDTKQNSLISNQLNHILSSIFFDSNEKRIYAEDLFVNPRIMLDNLSNPDNNTPGDLIRGIIPLFVFNKLIEPYDPNNKGRNKIHNIDKLLTNPHLHTVPPNLKLFTNLDL
jgi:hypothetical protein